MQLKDIGHNTLLGIGCVCVAIVAIISIFTGHDGLDLALATIATLSGAIPPVRDRLFPSSDAQTSAVSP